MVRSVLVEQAAALLGVSRRTVYYRIREGRLETIRTRCGSQRVLMRSIEQVLREDEERKALRACRRHRHRPADVSPQDAPTGPDAAV